MEWDELVIPDSRDDNGGALGHALALNCNTTPVVRNESRGVYIDTGGPMNPWMEGLGPNTRRKAFNRRAVFEKELGGYWQHCERNKAARAQFKEQLNSFHQAVGKALL